MTRPARSTGAAPSDDVIVIGAGIVGLATARALLARTPSRSIRILDKEGSVGTHQTAHNSGVVHSGLYYRPGSDKARLCTAGRTELEAWCSARGIEADRCGKVVVATSPDEIAPLDELHRRGVDNGLTVEVLDRRGLTEHEPHAAGIRALFVPATGVVDFAEVARRLADELRDAGVAFELANPVVAVHESSDQVEVTSVDGPRRADRLVNCAGLHSDQIARAANLDPPLRIVPFRGEFSELVPSRRHLVRHLIYPVPDPRFPFLGAHFTRGLDGSVHVGPNAVPALSREGYRWRDVSPRSVRQLTTDRATWLLARRYWRTGLGEVARSLVAPLLLRQLRRLVPDVGRGDLVPAGSGVRAQAVRDDGTLLDDFAIEQTARCVHVLNAPSPAATASLAIGRHVAAMLDG